MAHVAGRGKLFTATHAVAVVVVLLLTSCSDKTAAPDTVVSAAPTSSAGSPSSADGVSPSAPPGQHSAVDIAFVSVLLKYQQQEAVMADLTAHRSTSAALSQHAAAVGERGETSTVLASWLRGWGQPVPEREQWDEGDPHDRPGMIRESQLANLGEVSPSLFDRQWLSLAIAHHRGVLAVIGDERAAGLNPSVKAMAASVSDTYRRDLAALQQALAKITGP
ncbi:DUF305 domain-containing protein [Kribbella sp. DT2]|uniref:DUF305 domain-containing protein n=1 Tax=Kribbella sp. DT2 TaxID=3393427 RepID=UPI003CF4E8CE